MELSESNKVIAGTVVGAALLLGLRIKRVRAVSRLARQSTKLVPPGTTAVRFECRNHHSNKPFFGVGVGVMAGVFFDECVPRLVWQGLRTITNTGGVLYDGAVLSKRCQAAAQCRLITDENTLTRVVRGTNCDPIQIQLPLVIRETRALHSALVEGKTFVGMSEGDVVELACKEAARPFNWAMTVYVTVNACCLFALDFF